MRKFFFIRTWSSWNFTWGRCRFWRWWQIWRWNTRHLKNLTCKFERNIFENKLGSEDLAQINMFYNKINGQKKLLIFTVVCNKILSKNRMRATGVYIRSVFPRQLFLFHFQIIQLILFPAKIENFVQNKGVLTDFQLMKEVRSQAKNQMTIANQTTNIFYLQN